MRTVDSGIRMVVAANTLAPALAALHAKGFTVSKVEGGAGLLQATKGATVLHGEDPLDLLGLAAILEMRGACWQASDAEVDALLALMGET